MYRAFGRCIYCGTQSEPLSREHFIPFALGGNLVLPRASCSAHAQLTSALEREVARDTYGLHRAHEDGPTRRKGRHVSTLNQLVEVEGVDSLGAPAYAQIPARDLPRFQMVLHAQTPGMLRNAPIDLNESVTLNCATGSDDTFARLRERLGWSKISIVSPPIRPRSFLRVLAKIAHAYACAERQPQSFAPTLLPLILGEPVSETYYVGGFSPELPQASTPLSLREEKFGNQCLLLADISFHFFPLLPRYQVICGVL